MVEIKSKQITNYINLNNGFTIDYKKSMLGKFYYVFIDNYSEEKRILLLSFLDKNLIRFKKISDFEYKVYFENWVSLADLIEEEIA